ncbi:MAG: HAMP domain-containing sensor histidine kinase, partial [Pseudomonadota bacterium]
SHEIRTPLNAILGFSEVMKARRFGAIENDKYSGYVNDIHSSGEHLLSLINDLLDLSKVEAGKLELNFASVDLGEVVTQCVKLLGDSAKEARVIVRTSVQDSLPNVVADQRSMRQIVLNLLSNAIKFTDGGGQVIVSARLEKNGNISLKVKDTGRGMSEPELERAMEPFRQVQSVAGDGILGTGLGLPLTKALAEANLASFQISSEPQIGTVVEIIFPTTRVLAD